MPSTIGYIETPHASKYLKRLCRHFAHKVEATFDEHCGQVDFPFGRALMSADESGLTVQIDLADDEPATEQMAHGVIDNHLARMAVRENIEAMRWTLS